MAIKSLSTLLQEINQNITTNANGEVTGSILNNILNDMGDSLSESIYKYPKSTGLSSSDIGKIMMDNGSGEATLYQYTPAASEVPMKFLIGAEDIAIPYDENGPFGFENYAIKTIDLSGTGTGDTFDIYLGGILFSVEIAASQDNANYEAAYDATMATYRTNVIAAINAYETNTGNAYLSAHENGDNNKIDIVADSEAYGSQFVLIGQGNFQAESGGFIPETFTPNGSTITFEGDNEEETITSTQWRGSDPVTGLPNDPSTVLEEFQLLRDYINNNPDSISLLDNYTASINVDDNLELEENSFDRTELSIDDWDAEFAIDVIGRNAIPPAPSKFPMGRLVGIDGNDALISHRFVETFELEAPININRNLLDANFNPELNEDILSNILELVIIPSEDGKARPITFDDVVLNDEIDLFGNDFRHNALGFAIASTDTHVTVVNMPMVFNVSQLLLKTLISGGVIEY